MRKPKVFSAILLFALLGAERGIATAAPESHGKKPLAGYSVLVVEKFTVEKPAATRDYPGGYEAWLRNQIMKALQDEGLFEQVVDVVKPTGNVGPSEPDATDPKRQLVLSGSILAYKKGSRAIRLWVGIGAGAASVKARFVFRDAKSGQEIFRAERKGSFDGMFDPNWGGSEAEALEAAGHNLVDAFIRDIKRNTDRKSR